MNFLVTLSKRHAAFRGYSRRWNRTLQEKRKEKKPAMVSHDMMDVAWRQKTGGRISVFVIGIYFKVNVPELQQRHKHEMVGLHLGNTFLHLFTEVRFFARGRKHGKKMDLGEQLWKFPWPSGWTTVSEKQSRSRHWSVESLELAEQMEVGNVTCGENTHHFALWQQRDHPGNLQGTKIYAHFKMV